MKINTKKKMKQLEQEFLVDTKDSPYNAQVKALEYLKKEHQVIQSVASKEKKRQMLLMIGYGAAAMTAAYEAVWNSTCADGPKKETPKEEETKKVTASAPPPPAADTSNTPKPAPEVVPEGKIKTLSSDNMGPMPAPIEPLKLEGLEKIEAVKLAELPPTLAVIDPPIDAPNGLDIQSDNYSKHATLESVREGNVYKSVVKDSNGNITGVVHAGKFYPELE